MTISVCPPCQPSFYAVLFYQDQAINPGPSNSLPAEASSIQRLSSLYNASTILILVLTARTDLLSNHILRHSAPDYISSQWQHLDQPG